MSYIGNQITGFLGTGSLTVTTSTVAVEGNSLFSADGNVVIGDASGDTITINAATASIPNNLNIDSNTLFLNASNNRVGIGNASPATALDVTGTITSDGLTVDGATILDVGDEGTLQIGATTTIADENQTIEMRGSNGSNELQRFQIANRGEEGRVDFKYGRAGATPTKAISIGAGTGDISFYEDTGTTAKLFWDASAEALGLGTSSPDYMLDIEASSPTARLNSTANNGVNTIWFGHSDDADAGAIRYWGSASGLGSYANSLTFNTNGTQAVHIDASQNVGIGTTSLSTNTLIKELHIDSPITNGLSRLRLSSSVENMEALISLSGYLGDDSLIFSIGSSGDGSATERMRIDSSGNLLVGQSSTTVPGLSNTTTGLSLTNNGYIFASKADDNVAWFNRNTSDGSIISLRKNGTAVGSIGTLSGYITIGRDDTAIVFQSAEDNIQPFNQTTNSGRDAAIDLGKDTVRFKDLYLSGSVYLGGTGSANALDDYEEGTWTPSYTAQTSNPTIDYNRRNGNYVKIGKLVKATVELRTNSISGGSGTLYISGLPFTANAPAAHTRAGTMNVGYSNDFTTLAPQSGIIDDGNTFAIPFVNNSSDARVGIDQALTVSNLTNGTGQNYLIATIIYETD